MGLWSRRRDKEATAKQQKSLVISEDVRDTFHYFGSPYDGQYGHIYRRQPAVRSVIDFRARNIAQLAIKTYARVDHNDRVELDDHPLALLLRDPNPTMTPYRLLYSLIADKDIYDRAYWRMVGLPVEALVRIPVSHLLRRWNGKAVEYRLRDGTPVPSEELVIFAGYTPEGLWNDEDGVPPMETLRRILAEAWASQEHREHFWRNSARREGTIKRPLEAPEWSPEARTRFRVDWENTMAGGPNAGRTGILEEGMEWTPDSFSPKEAEYIAGYQLIRDEVALEYGINPQLFKGDSANANIESFHRQLYQDSLGPELRDIQDVIVQQVLPRTEIRLPKLRGRTYCEFNLAEKLKGSFEEQARTLTTSTGVPWMAVEEARSRMNLPRTGDPDFATPIKPLNVMYGNQPAVTVPTAVPQPGPKRRARKSAPQGALRRRQEAAAAHTELFRRYFRAQQQAMHAKAAGFDMDRWNAKLTGELYSARVPLASKTGHLAASQVDGVYDEARTLNYLQETARRQAEHVNAQTQAALDDAVDDDAVAAVWEQASTSRAAYLGFGTATAIINFARNEAAKQSSQDGRTRTKTWVVTSDQSRHPEMDGETVNFDETFSNGCEWPGDAAGGADEVAGCECLLDLN